MEPNIQTQKQLVFAASDQPSSTVRRKMLSGGVGLATSASLGGLGLLTPGVAVATDMSTTTSCNSFIFASSNVPKMQIIWQGNMDYVDEDCTLINWVSRSKVVGYDSKTRTAYAGVITRIKKAATKQVTEAWTLKSSATLKKINGEWTSNYFGENGKLVLKLTKDELLNSVTYHKPWSYKEDKAKNSTGDEFRRRLDDDGEINAAERRRSQEAEIMRVFNQWFANLGDRRVGSNSRDGGPPTRQDPAIFFTTAVNNIFSAPRVGNEPPTFIYATITASDVDPELGRRFPYNMLLIRNARNPNNVEYYVLLEGFFYEQRRPLLRPTRSASRIVGYSQIHQLLNALIRLNQVVTSAAAARTALYAGQMEAIDHRLVPPNPLRYNLMPFHLINGLIGGGSLPAGDSVPIPLTPDIATYVSETSAQLDFASVLNGVLNEIDEDIRNGHPWQLHRFDDDNSLHRRLIGYTQDRIIPKKPNIPNTCRGCPSKDDIFDNDAIK
jgi:hypothetical protein